MTIRADIDALRTMVGKTGNTSDAALGVCLEAAGNWVYDRIKVSNIGAAEVQQAILLLAARLYKRRQSPEGVAGWDDMGSVRILSRDPDIERLLEQYIDAGKVFGVA